MAAEEKGDSFIDRIDCVSQKSYHLPVQVTTLRLTKDNYLHWFAAITMAIANRGWISYINGKKKQPTKIDPYWETWYLEDNQDEFEGIQSQILNSGEVSNIEDVYSKVEANEQRQLVVVGQDTSKTMFIAQSAMKNSHGKNPGGKKVVDYTGEKKKITANQIRELDAYLSRMDVHKDEPSDDVKINHALSVTGNEGLLASHLKEQHQLYLLQWSLHLEKSLMVDHERGLVAEYIPMGDPDTYS
ncbi:hypothetical protein EJ110_NYTH34226 [Nymphaea thermarum]|nr:hypothetical protein EJ110_NYTH34226 [Nymphaea thermarum]